MPPRKIHGVFRTALIAYGAAVLWWWFSRRLPVDESSSGWAPGGMNAIALGLGLQLCMLAVKWLVARYERNHRMEGMLAPTAVATAQLVIDGITVLLFATATLRSIVVAADAY